MKKEELGFLSVSLKRGEAIRINDEFLITKGKQGKLLLIVPKKYPIKKEPLPPELFWKDKPCDS